MIANLLSAALVVRLFAPAAEIPDPCSLVTAAQVNSILGKTPGKGTVTREVDQENQATTAVCQMKLGEELLMISVGEFASAAVALKGFNDFTSDPDDGPKVTPAPGLGDKAAWEARPDALWVVLKGKYMLVLMIGTVDADGTRYREPLKRLAAIAVNKLQP